MIILVILILLFIALMIDEWHGKDSGNESSVDPQIPLEEEDKCPLCGVVKYSHHPYCDECRNKTWERES